MFSHVTKTSPINKFTHQLSSAHSLTMLDFPWSITKIVVLFSWNIHEIPMKMTGLGLPKKNNSISLNGLLFSGTSKHRKDFHGFSLQKSASCVPVDGPLNQITYHPKFLAYSRVLLPGVFFAVSEKIAWRLS